MSEICAVRAYSMPKNPPFVYRGRKEPQKTWFDRILLFDTETTADIYQNLKFGYFEIYQHRILEYRGIFYDTKAIKPKEKIILKSHCKQNKIRLYLIEKFREIFIHEAYDLETLCVGFNLPFDLTRIAINASSGRGKRKSSFSLKLSNKNYIPRLYVKHVTNTFSFIEWGSSPFRKKRFKGNFVDLRTLTHALTNKKYSLDSVSKHYKTEYKKQTVKQHGKITPMYIEYCIQDVKTTRSVFLEAKKEFDTYKLEIPVTRAYTPASIGKEFLKMMGVKSLLEKNHKFSKKILGNIMTSYFGGRTENKIRKSPTSVDVLDFVSMYPTVCTLQNLWKFVIARHIEYHDATREIIDFIDGFTLEDIQDKNNWTRLQGIVLVEPDNDVLPLRARYGSKNVWNIGISHVTSKTPLWHSIADVLASKLYTGKTPKILKVFRFVPVGVQRGLKTIDIHGIKINPYKQDLFQELVQYKQELTNKDDPRKHIIKIIVNAISYGIFVEILTSDESKPIPVDVRGLESFTQETTKVEKFGYMFNPIIAVSITSASRLLLASTEILLQKHGATHAYCDTDSMMVPPKHTKEIQNFFRPLNPYDFDADIFKVERKNILFYGISAKRYCLYSFADEKIRICDDNYSSHGLGHLLNPLSQDEDNNDWNKEFWKDILDLHYRNVTTDQLAEKYQNKYALSKIAISSPYIHHWFKGFNKKNDYHNQIKPFNFCLVGFSNKSNDMGKMIKPLAPFRRPAREAVYHDFVDYNDKTRTKMRGKEYWKTLWDTFEEYLRHPESKFEGDTGILKRKHVIVSKIIHIGKESNNLEESDAFGVNSESYQTYEKVEDLDAKFSKISDIILKLNPKDVKKFGMSRQTLWNVKKHIKTNCLARISYKMKLHLLTIIDHFNSL
ncbi:MAG: hypothetical protein ACYDAJ_06905 [Nitrosotalea sp.]